METKADHPVPDPRSAAPSQALRIGTRSSKMALAQTARVIAALRERLPDLNVETVEITTSGDRFMGKLSELGGKGAFTKELDRAMLLGEIDIAIHCMKDVPGDRSLPEGLTFAAYLQRDDIRDALVSRSGQALAELPSAATIGTSSVRRQAQISALFPNLNPIPIRGNADTRLKKLDDGEYDALVLAVSGLQRIKQEHRITEILQIDRFCPAVGAGVIGLTCHQDDATIVSIAQLLNDEETARQVIAERTMLRQLGGNCLTPIAAYAASEPDGLLSLTAMVFSRDGATILEAFEVGDPVDPIALGTNAAQALLRKGARELIDGTPSRKLTHTTPGGLAPR